MKRQEPRSIAQIVGDFMQQESMDAASQQLRACAMWPHVVGPGIDALTTRRWVKDGIITVHISSASLRNELQMQRSAIVARINDAMGSDVIKDIHVR